MSTPIEPRPVIPTGSQRVGGFVEYTDGPGAAFSQDEPTYPPSPRGTAFRAAREALGLSMGTTARRLGIRVTELSDIELGRMTLSAEDWERARAILETEADALERRLAR